MFHDARFVFLILIILQITLHISAGNLRPVHERNNEQKVDSYGNPLGGNTQAGSKQRVKIYMHDQQKRFNSEKDRMQRAQVQRFQIHGGETMDSYVKAFKDQQETYQKEIEKKQAKEVTSTTRSVNVNKKELNNGRLTVGDDDKVVKESVNANRWWKNSRPVRNSRGNFKNADSVTARTTVRGHQITRPHKSRSVPYVLSPNYFTPSATHESAGGNFGFGPQNPFLNPSTVSSILAADYAPGNGYNTADVSALTSATLSDAQAQQFSQLNGYKSSADVESLTALLGKEPDDQLRGLNELLNQHSNHKLIGEDLRNLNINIKASSLDPPEGAYVKKYDYVSPYSTNIHKDGYGYTYDDDQSVGQIKDHTPITENVQDIADTRGPVQFSAARPVYPTAHPLTPTSTNYYKLEVSGQSSHDKPKILHSAPSSFSGSSFGHGNDEVSIESEAETIFNNLKWNQPRNKHKYTEDRKKIPRSLSSSSHLPDVDNITGSIEINSSHANVSTVLNEKDNLESDVVNVENITHKIMKRQINLKSSFDSQDFKKPLASMIRLKRTSIENNTTNKVNSIANRLRNSSDSFLDSNLFLTPKDFEYSNNTDRQISSNDITDSSEFYYYDDTENANDTNIDFDDDLFSTDDDNSPSFNDSLSHYNLTPNGTNISSDNPHFESLTRYKTRKRPNLYRVLNGIKSKIHHPNPARFKQLLVKRPRNGFSFIKNPHDNIYGRGTSNYGSSGVGYQIERPFRDDSIEADEYSDEYEDGEYSDGSDSENEYYDVDDYGYRQNGGRINLNRHKTKYSRYELNSPYDTYNRGSSLHNQYAASYIGNNDYITGGDNLNYYDNYNYNSENTRGVPYFINNVRYASDYNQDADYVENDYEVDNAPAGQRNYFRVYPAGDSSDYTDSRKAYLDYFNKLTKHRNGNTAASHHHSAFVPSDNEEYVDDAYEAESHGGDDGDAGNYYVENFNQFITEHKEKRRKKKRPQSNFNIYRTATNLGHKLHSINPANHIPLQRKPSDVVHIDAVNIFHNKQQHIKPHHHRQQSHRFRPVKQSHRTKRPRKWHRPRYVNRGYNKKTQHVLHLQNNLSKINAKLVHARIIR